jgi:hypothetical protein
MLTTPWQDTVSANRLGWRQRAANLNGELAFAVTYQLCHRCRLGWVEQPYTLVTGGADWPAPPSPSALPARIANG